ncbi:MAG TPA: FMN-binding protein [Acidimicrobiales bacterium]|nr:FMN-binding protein [Acidimicrobiales bacterium]
MRRAPAVVAASAAGFAGVLALHSGSRPSILSGSGPPATPVTSSPTATAPITGSVTPLTGAATTALGNSEQYGYGVLAVRVTVRGGHITNVSVANLQTAEQYSQLLAQQVIPVLRNEVLSAQSAHINAISGATYTSEAYAYSVQSALDRLGAK